MTELHHQVNEELLRLENAWTDASRHAECMDESENFSEGEINRAYNQAEEAENAYWNHVDIHHIAWYNNGVSYRREV